MNRDICPICQAMVVSHVVEKRRLVVEVESLASSWKKITTRRREGVGVVVEKNEEESTNFQRKFVRFTYSNNAHRRLDDVTTALYRPYRKLKKN